MTWKKFWYKAAPAASTLHLFLLTEYQVAHPHSNMLQINGLTIFMHTDHRISQLLFTCSSSICCVDFSSGILDPLNFEEEGVFGGSPASGNSELVRSDQQVIKSNQLSLFTNLQVYVRKKNG
ncbi:hypothetical protein GQR58_030708 [Nymphon striatum]|nr:hypothetical protein GQR58_030708 [Nymphon striatum]